MSSFILILSNSILILSSAIILIAIALLYKNTKCENSGTEEVRDIILNRDDLEQHAREIADGHKVSPKAKSCSRLLERMESNYRLIMHVYRELNSSMKKGESSAPAVEWLLDNFYIIEAQVKEIRLNFPRGYYLSLPRLIKGPLRGFPRAYGIALELISHTDGRLDERVITGFLEAYQSRTPLTSRELWAVPIMLKIALIENIRRICEDILKAKEERKSAEGIANAMFSGNDEDLLNILKERTEGMDKFGSAFSEHLLKLIRRRGIESGAVMHFIDEKLAAQDSNTEDIVQLEHRNQAKRQLSIGNSITGLRFVSSLIWNDIFESLSPVEKILMEDPANIYPAMDFSSRDYYRHGVEEISKTLRISETLIGKKAVECAEMAQFGDMRHRHVGYYIAGKGRDELYDLIGYRPNIRVRIKRFAKKNPVLFYILPIVVLTAAISGLLAYYGYVSADNGNILTFLAVCILLLLPASDLSVNIVNWIITHGMKPSFLPKLELKEGIPEEMASMVVIPTLLPNEDRVGKLLQDLEIYYLANREENIYFALLGDFPDSEEDEELPEDEQIIKSALQGVKELNKKYGDIFYFFNRRREFNSCQGVWMGWERKRGKLEEFNRLLRGDKNTTYNVISGDISKLPEIKYVITLDADTELPLEAAKKLIGTIAHPLNSAVMDDKSRVIGGYGILQPRVTISAQDANRSRFSRIFAGQGGIDTYSTAVSDVYQDLFEEGIFTGKGIYDVDVFLKALNGYIPENAVLSHDLLEGCYTRAGLVTDIELVDGFPSTYNSYAARLHRWVRGDWQLLPWLGSRVKDRNGEYVENPLSLPCKWKIFDNMRRSLVPPSLVLFILMALSYLPGNELLWLAFGILIVAFPILSDIADAALIKSRKAGRSLDIFSGFKSVAYQVLLIFVFLPYQAYFMMDAVIRTIIRLKYTKKNLLEWESAADAEARLKNQTKSFFTRMWAAPVIGCIMFALTLASTPRLWYIALLIVLMWILSPSAALWVSNTIVEEHALLSIDDISKLRQLARKTWRYFEEFAESEDNYLPPDNYQEEPENGIAHRTSPTNIGFLLLSVLAARDMGYITTSEMNEKINNTLVTIEKMDTWKGHLYNWYDTKTLEPLRPLYVSTVDSGNLVGYLMTIAQGLLEYEEKPIVDEAPAKGLLDTIEIFNSEGTGTKMDTGALEVYIDRGNFDPLLLNQILNGLKNNLEEIKEDEDSEISPWLQKVDNMVNRHRKEIMDTMPWVGILPKMPESLKESYGDKIDTIIGEFRKSTAPKALSSAYNQGMLEINGIISSTKELPEDEEAYLKELKSAVMNAYLNVNRMVSDCRSLADRAKKIADNTKFAPLFDAKRQLFSIGYNAEEERLSLSYYDLLASECRQTSFIAIARGEIGQSHWFMLGRPVTVFDRVRGLVSWTGTMFEYLMPLILMKNYKGTLLDQTYGFVLKTQIAYGRKRHVPWGVSESGYYAFDINFNYQYRAFGVPRLGLKRGLINDMVVSPYSTILALMVDPKSAVENIRKLKSQGIEGPYGFYEAVDYTPERLPAGQDRVIVKNFMVHHHGMSLAALDNLINNNIMQDRFHRDPVIKSAELLLQEKVPARLIVTKEVEEEIRPFDKEDRHEDEFVKVFKSPCTQIPEAHILSNGTYSLMLTNSGSGYSRSGDISLTRWREDATVDRSGMFFYIQNINSNNVWSAAYEPYGVIPEEYRATFSSDKIEYFRVDGNMDTHTEITVSPEDNAEVRRISLTNHSDHSRVIEVTSYFEAVIAPQSADAAHPAFGNLFVRTEFLPRLEGLLATRRPRTPEQKPLWTFHGAVTEGETVGSIQYETDRARFIGRNRDITDPEALDVDHPLSNTSGAVLDPIMSLRRRVRINPGETARISYITGIGASRDEAVELLKKYLDPDAVNRTFELAWTRSQVDSRYLNLKSHDIELYQKMLSQILFITPLRKILGNTIKDNRKGQSALWPYGISGDLPIMLLSLKRVDDLDILSQVLKAHEYWRAKGLKVDLVVLNEDEGSYIQDFHDRLRNIISSSHAREIQDRPGGVFLRQASVMAPEDRTLLYTAARIVLKGGKGSIWKQLKLEEDESLPKKKNFKPVLTEYPPEKEAAEKLDFFNGIGGFRARGSEYVIRLEEGKHTPAPWINVVSNGKFGFQVTESGSGYTWSENSRENKLTPWSNDPVTDPVGEAIYIRDEEDGAIWSPTPFPARGEGTYIVRHGFGYSAFESTSRGIKQELTMFVPMDESIKILKLKLKNLSGVKRTLSAIFYLRPVLGVTDQVTAPYIVTGLNKDTGVLMIKNTYSDDFPGRTGYMDCSIVERTVTGDREEFIGRCKSLEWPDALKRECLSGRTGAGLDPCGAIMVKLELGEKEEKTLSFTLGQCLSDEEAISTALKYRDLREVEAALRLAVDYWKKSLGVVRVNTPDPSTDIMINGWLLYQSMACRIWARSAFYQSGGAYGFRDQLQDVLSVLNVSPDLARNQILHSASHQFLEGDVQHWWHPVTDKGIRTRFSDDLLWLPYVTYYYTNTTGDYSVLDEKVPFLEDEPLKEGEDERYNKPRISEEKASVYEHCIRAIEHSLKFGPHGIPLMGSGDWNDGMSTVGNKGRGESVWLGWFLYTILRKFSSLCSMKEEDDRAERYLKTANEILSNIEKNAWDGSWYRRAYFDDGTPLGSASNSECRIDSLGQSWSVISGGGRPERSLEAMEALEKHLIKRDEGLIQLLTPPFDDSDLEPGYIKGYVPGVRENGGQYTHAATWVILAFAKLGMGDKAWELYSMINPINHTRTPMEYLRYKVEPYVMAADVYAVEPHTGRGGWTWYTGTAGWMYRICVEYMLGLKVRGDRFTMAPCIPKAWEEYTINYTHKDTLYSIKVKNPNGVNEGVKSIHLDGKIVEDNMILLADDHRNHNIEVIMG